MWRMTFSDRRICSQNGAQWDLFFGLKEWWEYAFYHSSKVPREKSIYFNKKGFKDEDESLPGGDGVTRFEGNLVLRVKIFLEEGE